MVGFWCISIGIRYIFVSKIFHLKHTSSFTVLQRLLGGESPPNKVQEVKTDVLESLQILHRDDGMNMIVITIRLHQYLKLITLQAWSCMLRRQAQMKRKPSMKSSFIVRILTTQTPHIGK